jgi:hypothetical protein
MAVCATTVPALIEVEPDHRVACFLVTPAPVNV